MRDVVAHYRNRYKVQNVAQGGERLEEVWCHRFGAAKKYLLLLLFTEGLNISPPAEVLHKQ